MFTPSIIVLLMMNTVAASGALLVALQAAVLEPGQARGTGGAVFSERKDKIADAA